MRKILWLALLAVPIIVVLTLPARVVVPHIGAGEDVGEVSGTLWQGEAVWQQPGLVPVDLAWQWDGGRTVADHLYDLGHRNIAYIAGPEHTEVARERRDGFSARIDALSTPEDPIHLTVRYGEFDFTSSEALARELLLPANPAERVTAIATASDQQAIGVLRCARDIGIHVPQDVSVVGFDDINLACLVVPRLTTLRQPIEDMAAVAVNRVLNAAENSADHAIRGFLVVRESTAHANRWT